VSNVPKAVDNATADANMFLILGALRGFNTSMLALRKSQWRGHPPPRLGHDPEGKVLGILGMGGIGKNLKKKAEAFGMTVQYYNRNKLDDEISGGAKYVSFDELLSTSDVLSLNLPLNVCTKQFAHVLRLTKSLAGYPTYHLNERVREDEEGNCHCQHSTGRGH
jgi:lactate dehydrogenase-like 2-hydroxyacid dehydrogenase